MSSDAMSPFAEIKGQQDNRNYVNVLYSVHSVPRKAGFDEFVVIEGAKEVQALVVGHYHNTETEIFGLGIAKSAII